MTCPPCASPVKLYPPCHPLSLLSARRRVIDVSRWAACHAALVVASPACAKTVEAFLQALQTVDISLAPSFAPQMEDLPSNADNAVHLAVADKASTDVNTQQLHLQQKEVVKEQLRGQAGVTHDVRKGKLQGLKCKPEQAVQAMGGNGGRANGFS